MLRSLVCEVLEMLRSLFREVLLREVLLRSLLMLFKEVLFNDVLLRGVLFSDVLTWDRDGESDAWLDGFIF